MTHFAANRRRFLRGFGLGAGATLLSPFVSDLLRRAQGQPATKRLVVMTGSWSFADRLLYPMRQAGEADFDLNPTMAPLEPFKRDLLMVTNFSVVARGTNGGHGWNPSDYFSGRKGAVPPGEAEYAGPSSGPSFDRFVAQRIGTSTRFMSIAVSNATNGGTPSTDGPGKGFPAWRSAIESYDALFTQGVPGAAGVDPKILLARDKSVLDFMTGDVRRLSARLASPEREKLDRFADAIRQMERKVALSTMPVASCAVPARPASNLYKLPLPWNGSVLEAPNGEAQAEIAATAVGCGLTNVAMVAFTGDNAEGYGVKVLQADGTAFEGIHGVNHLNHAGLATLQKWRMTQVAKVAGKLRDLGLADSSLVMYTDANGSVHHTNGDATFMITIGSLGGHLKTGRVLVFGRPGDKKYTGPARRPINDVYTTLANGLGVDVDKFGDPAVATGPLAWLRG